MSGGGDGGGQSGATASCAQGPLLAVLGGPYVLGNLSRVGSVQGKHTFLSLLSLAWKWVSSPAIQRA